MSSLSRTAVVGASLLLAAPAMAGEWVGWLVGEPCAASLQVADCPLRHVDKTVLLLENGEKLTFAWGDGKAVSVADVDKSYAKRVRLSGEIKAGVLAPTKLDVLETSSEKKFFKGCL
ncbi:MAG: hypothetical protein Q8L93_03815 [Rhodocyclaceae bacterium]|nr:hypothetical protein [Rhodocyclaceae bacterium]